MLPSKNFLISLEIGKAFINYVSLMRDRTHLRFNGKINIKKEYRAYPGRQKNRGSFPVFFDVCRFYVNFSKNQRSRKTSLLLEISTRISNLLPSPSLHFLCTAIRPDIGTIRKQCEPKIQTAGNLLKFASS